MKTNKHFKTWLLIAFVLAFMPVAKAAIPNGSEQNPNFPNGFCTGTSTSDTDSALATDSSQNYILVWEDVGCNNGGTNIYFQRYNKLGAVQGNPVLVDTTTTNQTSSAISMDQNGNFVIAWVGNAGGVTGGIYAKAFGFNSTNNTVAAVGSAFLVNTDTANPQENPRVALNYGNAGNAGNFVIVWDGVTTADSQGGVSMQRYTVDFTGSSSPAAAGANVLVNSYTASVEKQADVAMNNFGEITVVWSGSGTGYASTNEVWLQAYGNDGTAWGTNQRVNANSGVFRPSIASDKSSEPSTNLVPGGKFIISYDGESSNAIYARLLNRCTNIGCVINPVELNVNTTTTNSQIESRLSADYLGNFTVTWENDNSPNGSKILAQSYNYLGQRIGTEFQVEQASDQADRILPAIVMDRYGNYTVSWSNGSNSSGIYAVLFRRYITDIFKSGGQTLANTPNTYNENSSSAAIASNGNRIVAFVDQDPNTNQIGIFYSLYDSSNNVIVQNVRADTSTDSSPTNPSVAFFKDISGTDVGRFIITWEENDPTGTDPGVNVFYREFDNTGTPQSASEILVSQTSSSTETNTDPRVAAGFYRNAGGSVNDGFTVSWTYTNTNLSSCQTMVEAAYHNFSNNFTTQPLETENGVCADSYPHLSADMNGEINGNDEPVYTWSDSTGIQAAEANNGTIGPTFKVNGSTNAAFDPDVSFVSPTQYIITWTECNNQSTPPPCNNGSEILAKRYTGNFAGADPMVTDNDFIVYGGDANNQSFPHITADFTTGTFLIVWQKNDSVLNINEIYGKFFMTNPQLANFGVGFPVNSSVSGNVFAPSVNMSNQGQAIVSWEGDFGTTDTYGVGFQMLSNPLFVQGTTTIPTTAQLQIAPGGKTLTIPSTIQFPSVPANTTNPTTVDLNVAQNPAAGQPLYFQIEDLGGNPQPCPQGTCYSVNVAATPLTYTDTATGQTYTIPASDIEIRNYDLIHSGVVDTGACGAQNGNGYVPSSKSFELLFGDASDFSLDPSTCDFAALDAQKTILNKTSNTSDTAKIQLYPTFRINIPALTPPGTYSGTITITSS